MADDISETPTKAARVLILGFALACAFRAVDHYEWPWTADSVVSLATAVVLTVVDWKLPWVLRYAGARTTRTLNAVATDVRWWIVIGIVLFFTMSVSEGISKLSDELSRPIPSNHSTWPDPTDDDYEGKPLGFLWGQSFFMFQPVNGQINVLYYTITGKNVGQEEVKINAAYLISATDSGVKIPLMIQSIPDGLIAIFDAAPIPVQAHIELHAPFSSDKLLSEESFLKSWSSFYVVIEASNEKLRHLISRDEVSKQLYLGDPQLSPHVTKRK